MGAKRIKFDLFPEGLRKAVVFSFDDGRVHDRRLVDIMNDSGLRGTFHLNSGVFGKEGYIEKSEVAELFKGHEVSAHSVTHPFLQQTPNELIIKEMIEDRAALEELTGQVVRGMSYPFGTYDDRVVAMLPGLGIEYARTVNSHGGFHMPEDLLRWHPTCHHKEMAEKTEAFLSSTPYFSYMELLFIWGHSYEFQDDDNWELMEETGKRLGSRKDAPPVWHATMSEIAAYRKGLAELRFGANGSLVHNPSALELWISVDGEAVKIGSGQTLKL